MSDAVQQIKDRLNILDVVSPYVELHKAGKNFKGKSPFAAEKTPSFYVSPDRGMYYCFSTSQGGDIFTFIQAMEGVDFKEALKILAQKAGIELVPEDPKKRSERERLLAAMNDAVAFYTKALESKKTAQEYLSSRAVSAETIQRWQIGYAPGPPDHGWRELKEQLEKKGYTQAELLKAGLIKTTDSGKQPFDVFRDRIVFPMADSGGKVVAFSGRILTKDTDAPKYVNSPETELYKKSELLFGYDKAKHGIRQLDFSLIVEGQFDVVMSHQAGYGNAVAVSGTALTINHVQLLERLSKRVVLALDADRAGIAAMKRAADLMLKRGLDVKVAELPEGKDPADLVAQGKEKLKQTVGKSVHVIEFLLHVLKRTETDARTLKLKAREEILPFILLLPNRIDQEHFVEIVAKEIGTTVDAIRFELDRLREQQSPATAGESEPTDAPQKKEAVQKERDNIKNTYTFLLASSELIDPKEKEVVRNTLHDLLAEDEVPEPDTKEVAAATFTLEQQYEKMAPQAVKEEIISRLNVLKQALIRRKLTKRRTELESNPAEDQITALESIASLERKRREPPYDNSLFTATKD